MSIIINPYSFAVAGGGALPTTGLILRLEADSLSQSDNTDADPWTDISVSANHATKGSGSNAKYRSSVDGLPAIELDGTDDYFQLTSSIADGEWTFFSVYKPTGSTTRSFFGGTLSAAAQMRLNNSTTPLVYFVKSGVAEIDHTTSPISNDAWNILVVTRSVSVAGVFYTNGTVNAGFAAQPAMNAITRIGSSFNGAANSEFFKTYFRAVGFYNFAMNATEAGAVTSALNAKYAVF